jgi:hypothetical protein
MPYQIVYSSQAIQPMRATDLEKILMDARVGNETRNVTGVLIYVDGVFFQILEGDKDVVVALMKSIAQDSRHSSVKIISESDASERAFGSWRMAYLNATPDQMSIWAGLPGTITIESILEGVEHHPQGIAQIAKGILEALKD